MILLEHRRRTMRPKKPETTASGDLFRARSDHQPQARTGTARRPDRLGLYRQRDGPALQRQGPARARCLIPGFDGALFSREWKDALWDRFFTAAPQRQRQSVEQYKIVKRA